MSLGIRTEAAVVNEKNLDRELAFDALLYGIELYEKIAKGKLFRILSIFILTNLRKKVLLFHLIK